MIGVCTLLAVCIPFIHDLDLLLAMRFLQGIASGTMIPVLMMAALKFLPPHIRLHGLALYALTATFAPNLSIWLAGLWTDGLFDWRWVYWQILPRSEEYTSELQTLMRISYAVFSLNKNMRLMHPNHYLC